MIQSKALRFETRLVYPRCGYFRNRLGSIFARWKRQIAKLPDLSGNPANDVERVLAAPQGQHVQVVVHCYGNSDLQDARLVGADHLQLLLDTDETPPSGDTATDSVVHLLYVRVEDLNTAGKQTVSACLQDLAQMGNVAMATLLLVVDVAEACDQPDFRTFIHQRFSQICQQDIPEERIVLPKDNKLHIGRAVDHFLASEVISALVKMKQYSEKFLKLNNSAKHMYTLEKCIAEIKSGLQDVFSNFYTVREMLQIPERTDEMPSVPDMQDKFVDHFLSYFSYAVRFRMHEVVFGYVKSHDLVQWLLEKTQMEEKCKQAVVAFSEKLKNYYLLNRNARGWKRSKDNDDIFSIRDVVDLMLKMLEEKLFKSFFVSMRSTLYALTTLEKMVFEMQGCLNQCDPGQCFQQTTLPDSLKMDLLRLREVFGLGIIYGILTVHVKVLTEAVTTSVQRILGNHGYGYEHRIQQVLGEPVLYCEKPVVSGKEVRRRMARKPQRGTLGGFMQDSDTGDLYALTSAHVVRHCTETADVDVEVESESGFQSLGVNTEDMSICTGSCNGQLCDVAAVKVVCDMKQKCQVRLKDDESNSTELYEWEMFADDPWSEDLAGKKVYMYGAMSNGLVEGLVSCSNYNMKVNEEFISDFIILIEVLPGNNNVQEQRGDVDVDMAVGGEEAEMLEQLPLPEEACMAMAAPSAGVPETAQIHCEGNSDTSPHLRGASKRVKHVSMATQLSGRSEESSQLKTAGGVAVTTSGVEEEMAQAHGEGAYLERLPGRTVESSQFHVSAEQVQPEGVFPTRQVNPEGGISVQVVPGLDADMPQQHGGAEAMVEEEEQLELPPAENMAEIHPVGEDYMALPVGGAGNFGQEGDSGSFICRKDPGHSKICVVSLMHGGFTSLRIEGIPETVSMTCHMKRTIMKLSEKMKKTLVPVEASKEKTSVLYQRS